MTKKLLEFFESKYNEKTGSPKEAFQATIDEIGFQAYADRDSFERAKRRKKRSR